MKERKSPPTETSQLVYIPNNNSDEFPFINTIISIFKTKIYIYIYKPLYFLPSFSVVNKIQAKHPFIPSMKISPFYFILINQD